MTRVRPFVPEDVPAVLALRRDRFWSPSEHPDDAARAAYLVELFFGNPWVDDKIAPLVAEDGDGRLLGFLGVVPRRMALHGVPLRVATTTHLMVARDAGPMVALQLMRALFDGPQALTLADAVNPRARRLWEHFGGVAMTAGSLIWVRPLRPLTLAASALRRRPARLARLVVRPLDALATRALARIRPPAAPAAGTREDAGDAALLACVAGGVDGRALRGEYDEASLGWLLGMLAKKRSCGTLRRARVVDARGPLGWYVFFANPGGNARVVHAAARPGAAGIVLDHLFHQAWREGCGALSGRFDARLVDALVERGCPMVGGTGNAIMVHARERDVRDAVARDEGCVTRLDGEWWTAY